LEAVLDYVRLGYEVHFRHLGLAQLFTLADLVLTCNQLLGWDEAHAMNLLHGLSEKSSEPSRRLADLVKMAKKRPRIQDVLNRLDGDTVRSIRGVDSEFTKEFESYLREFGLRALSYEVIEPTLGEMPTFILKLVRDQLIQGYDPAAKAAELEKMREDTETEAFAKLTARPEGDRQHFREVLDRARFAYPVREDNVFYTLNMGDGLMRLALLELGRRLVQRSLIARYDDVFFLELKEARNALRAGGDLHEVVIRRREEMAWAERNVGPISYGKKPELPSLPRGLPEEMHYLMERILWAMQLIGTASSGKYTGTARIIISESQFGKLQQGDVLICPITSPAWSVLFSNLGALVTDIGSVLSHPAILAREFGIPAVVATGKATKLVRDGQRVTVDGISGALEIHET
jgi:pyruvate,water dikinase